MFYVELEAKGSFDTDGNVVANFGVRNPPFEFDNLQAYTYYSGTGYSLTNGFWTFSFNNGLQDAAGNHDSPFFSWAVRDITPVPVPTTILLFGSGLIGLVGFRYKFKKQ